MDLILKISCYKYTTCDQNTGQYTLKVPRARLEFNSLPVNSSM